jgi:hypothetical protein
MAFLSVTTTFTGPANQGLQVGYNSGSVQTHIHAPGKCPPATALTDTVLTALWCAERPETPPQPSCFVPFRRDADFVDRGALLDQIRELCAAPASRIALVGLGGVGYVRQKRLELLLASNVSIGSRSWPLSTATAPLSSRQTHGCSGHTLATRRG